MPDKVTRDEALRWIAANAEIPLGKSDGVDLFARLSTDAHGEPAVCLSVQDDEYVTFFTLPRTQVMALVAMLQSAPARREDGSVSED